eukprot:1158127-Pelagomonas_calceolata.AAC.12
MMYEDSMNLIAKLPQIAAMIYRKEFKNGDFIEPHPQLDWAANLSYMMVFFISRKGRPAQLGSMSYRAAACLATFRCMQEALGSTGGGHSRYVL